MKKAEISNVLSALKKVRMPKISDKEVRNALIKNHLFLLGQGKKYDEEIEKLRTVHLGSYEKELAEVQELQFKMQQEQDAEKKQKMVEEINSHTDLLQAINSFNKAVYDLGEEKIEISKINGEKFAEEYGEQDYDPAVVEALYVMFE